MHTKRNRQNSNFQIVNFLCGSCHTPDGAYSLLLDLRQDRKLAIDCYESSKLREKAKRLRAEKMLESEDMSIQLEGQADISEMAAMAEISKANYSAAVDELNTIQQCIDALQPVRKYAHLSDAEAHEASQSEEWGLELIHRAENSLLTTGLIPTDHFATMRQHPAFLTEILPAINNIQIQMRFDGGREKLLSHQNMGIKNLLTLMS